jgi:BlaI family penicillinase repressor
MTKAPHDVPEAQLAVLRVLWEHGPATRRRITDELYPGGGPSAYTTVQKLLERLVEKGFVRRDETAEPLTFAAVVSRDELISRRLADVAEQLCSGSFTPLLLNLVNARPLSAEELAQLRAVVRRLSRQAREDEPRS